MSGAPGLRRLHVRDTGPGRGSAGMERDPERSTNLAARIGIIATILMGQLWGLTVALNAWSGGQKGQALMVLGFEVLSFAVSVVVWLMAPGEK